MGLVGRRCDERGSYLPLGAPPPAQPQAHSSDWTPFRNRIEFEFSEFVYTREQMSAGNIDVLLDLWAASLFRHDVEPPFVNHTDLYDTIDSIPLGDVPWQCFQTSFRGAKPTTGEIPSWMTTEYEVWFRDPRGVVRNMLANPSYHNKFDYVPVRNFNANGERQFRDFMSGDWAWKHAVIPPSHVILPSCTNRVYLGYNRCRPSHAWCNVCANHSW
jgi:Plavaka transposase